MILTARAWRARQAARLALREERWRRAHGSACEAQRLHATPEGERLVLVATLCMNGDAEAGSEAPGADREIGTTAAGAPEPPRCEPDRPQAPSSLEAEAT